MGKFLGWQLVCGRVRSQALPSASSRQASASYNLEQHGEMQMCVQDVILDVILTTSEVALAIRNCCIFLKTQFYFQLYHPFKTIQKYLLDIVCCQDRILV